MLVDLSGILKACRSYLQLRLLICDTFVTLILVDSPLTRPWFDRRALVNFFDLFCGNYGLISRH